MKTEIGWSSPRCWIVVCAVVFGAGCGGFADQVRADDDQPDAQAQQEAQQTAELLYESMVEVFRQDTAGVDLKYRERLTVVSDYEDVEEKRRRRFVGRIVAAQGGLGVNITAEYQNDTAAEGEEPDWEDQPRQAVKAEAEPDELKIARRVERMYHSGGP